MKKAFFSKFLWFFALLAIDLLSKQAALRWIPPFQGASFPFGGIPLIESGGFNVSLNTVFNTGAAWGVFAGYSEILLIIRLCIAGALFAYLLSSQRSLFLWVIAAGAIGNIIDMIFFGHVIDFLHLQFFGWSFPLFNVADSCITLGVICLMLWPNHRLVLEGSKQ